MSADDVTIAEEPALQDDVRAMVAELNAETLRHYAPHECHHLTVEQMAESTTTVFVARRAGQAIAMGALRRHGEGLGEVKRMYTRPDAQGLGVGAAILSAITAKARGEGLTRLALETGDRLAAAVRLYERAGFTACGPFADYTQEPTSLFMDRPLSPAASSTETRA